MFSLLLMFQLTEASTNEWVTTDIEHQCLFQKNSQVDKHSVLRVECTWTVPFDTVLSLIEPADRFDEFLSGVDSSDRIASPSEIIRIVQTYSFPGVNDRAIVLDYRIENIQNGKRIHFNKALDQSHLPNGFVEVVDNSGFWEITQEDGSTKLVFESSFNPGGYLPEILFKWFQGPGTRQMMGELKQFSESGT